MTEITEESNFDLKSTDLTNVLKTFSSISKEVDIVYKKDTDMEGLIKKSRTLTTLLNPFMLLII